MTRKNRRELARRVTASNIRGNPRTWMSSTHVTREPDSIGSTLSSAQPVTKRPRFSSRQNVGSSQVVICIGSSNPTGPTPVRATKPDGVLDTLVSGTN